MQRKWCVILGQPGFAMPSSLFPLFSKDSNSQLIKLHQTQGTVPALGPHRAGEHGAHHKVLTMEKTFKPVSEFTAKTSAKTADFLGTLTKILLKYYSQVH